MNEKPMWMQEGGDNDVVSGIYHGRAEGSNREPSKAVLLSVYLPHHELISCLQERVNPQAEGKPAVDDDVSLRTHHKAFNMQTKYNAHCNSQLSAELSSFSFGQPSVGCEDGRFH